LFDVSPARVVDLLDDADAGERVWSESELSAVLAHQLGAPVQFNLSQLDTSLAAQLRDAAEAEGLLLNSLGDLLHHPCPPIELLVLTKDFAKRCRMGSASTMPEDVASVVYYTAIAAALVRCRRKISELSDAELRRGVKWALARAWLDDATRGLLREAWERLNS